MESRSKIEFLTRFIDMIRLVYKTGVSVSDLSLRKSLNAIGDEILASYVLGVVSDTSRYLDDIGVSLGKILTELANAGRDSIREMDKLILVRSILRLQVSNSKLILEINSMARSNEKETKHLLEDEKKKRGRAKPKEGFSKSQRVIISVITRKGIIRSSELYKKVNDMSERTVRRNVEMLEKMGKINREPIGRDFIIKVRGTD